MMPSILSTLVILSICFPAVNGFKLNSFNSRSIISYQSTIRVRCIEGAATRIYQPRSDLSLQAGADESSEKKEGIEPKYLGALGVFIFAALYDFFITHGGQPYLAHPPSL